MIKNSFSALLCGLMLVQGYASPILASEEAEAMEEIEASKTDEREMFTPEAGEIVHSGKIGTADWTIDSNGTLTWFGKI